MTVMRTSQREPVDRTQDQLRLVFEPKYLTIDQVAELLAVPKSFIYRRTAKGHNDPIPHYRLGGHLRFNAEDIEVWVESHRCQSEGAPRATAVAAARKRTAQRSTQSTKKVRLRP